MSNEAPDSKFMTPAEVADYLRVSREYVYRLCSLGEENGGLRSVALKGSIRARRIFRDSVDSWAESQPKNSNPDAA